MIYVSFKTSQHKSLSFGGQVVGLYILDIYKNVIPLGTLIINLIVRELSFYDTLGPIFPSCPIAI